MTEVCQSADDIPDSVVVVVVAPAPRISWSSQLLTPQKSQSRFLLLDYLCGFERLFFTD